MKLSEAIRIGAKMAPQCTTREMAHYLNGKIVATCALGAAAQAIGILDCEKNPQPYYELSERFDISESTKRIIFRMNDDEKLSREEIADWLEAHGL